MRKYILLVCSIFMLAGCNVNKDPQPEKQVKEIEVETIEIEPVAVEKKIVKQRVFPGTYYRIVTKSIEVFSYKGKLNNNSLINEKKLVRPFYIKGNLIKIENIYESTIGERYGKIAGKNLFVSMDDLATHTKK